MSAALWLALPIERLCLFEGFWVRGDDRVDRRALFVVGGDAGEVSLHEFFRGERARFHRPLEIGDSGSFQVERCAEGEGREAERKGKQSGEETRAEAKIHRRKSEECESYETVTKHQTAQPGRRSKFGKQRR